MLTGKQSKGMVELIMKDRAHSDIVNAFNKLEEKNLIRKSGYKPYAKGRKQYYYEITYDGLQLLISDNPNALKFWKALFGFCHHSNKGITSDNVENLCNLFMKKYLKYGNYGFFYQFEIFDNMRDQWLGKVIKENIPNLMQKIIEILAIHPRITLEELSENIGEGKSDVRACLSTYTLESYKPLIENTKYIYQNTIGKGKNKKYQDLILHSIVTTKEDGEQGYKTYELTLFGVILALTLVRFYDMEKLRHGLYYSNISFTEYYDKIASNYQDKLPLIFGKWQLLKNILGIFSDYNFDIILDKETRLRDSNNLSVIRGGNKELYDGISEIVLQTRQQIGEFVNTGSYVWLNYPSEMSYKYKGRKNQNKNYTANDETNVIDRPAPQKVYPLMKKINEIIIILNPLECAFFKSVSSSSEFIREVSHHLEELFANEVTAFYYFHLYYDYEFHTRVRKPTMYYSSLEDVRPYLPKSQRPKDCLSLILEKDKNKPLVREWLHRLTRDIVKLQKETYDTLKLTT